MRGDTDRVLALSTAWAVFICCSILPVGWMLIASAGSGSTALASALAAERQRVLLGHTVLLGTGAAAGALVVGTPIGVILARCDPERVRLARFVLVAPLVLPPYVLARTWVALVEGYAGGWTYGLSAATFTLAFSYYPVVMLATEAALRSISSHLEEAARLVASSARVWSNVLIPLLVPPLAASALVVFVLASSEFAVPSMLRARVYTTEVFTALSSLYDFRLATLMALPLGAIGAVAAIAALRVSRNVLTARADRGPEGATWRRRTQHVAVVALVAASAATLCFRICRSMLPVAAHWAFLEREDNHPAAHGGARRPRPG